MTKQPWPYPMAFLVGVLIGVITHLASKGVPTNLDRFIGYLIGSGMFVMFIAWARNRAVGAKGVP